MEALLEAIARIVQIGGISKTRRIEKLEGIDSTEYKEDSEKVATTYTADIVGRPKESS